MDAIDLTKAVEFIKSCQNFDGGFGSRPGAESHGGLIYCCVGALSIVGTNKTVNTLRYLPNKLLTVLKISILLVIFICLNVIFIKMFRTIRFSRR